MAEQEKTPRSRKAPAEKRPRKPAAKKRPASAAAAKPSPIAPQDGAISDILATVAAMEEPVQIGPKKAAAPAAASPAKASVPAKPAAKPPAMMDDDPIIGRPKKRRGVNPALIALVVFLFLIALSGTALLLLKLGVLKPSYTVVPPPTNTPAHRETVNATAMISADPKAVEGSKPLLATRQVETEVSAEQDFPATGTTQVTDAKSSGTVTITNGTSRPYTFVATTRLLSKDGVLFRLRDSATIPARGTVDAEVIADQAGAQGDIGATTFIFPGLTAALQEQITAESATSMTGGSGTAVAASAEDIAAAKAALEGKLRKDASDNFSAMLVAGERLIPELVSSEEIEVKMPKEGAPGKTFSISLKLRFRALLIPEAKFSELLEAKLSETAADGAAADLGPITYTVNAYDIASQTAEVRADAQVTR
jgi:hypothetical protein